MEKCEIRQNIGFLKTHYNEFASQLDDLDRLIPKQSKPEELESALSKVEELGEVISYLEERLLK